MKAFVADLDRKLRNFGVESRFFAEFRALIEQGTPPSDELGLALVSAANYQACLNSILTELSQPTIQRHFPSAVHVIEPLEIIS